MNEWVEVGVQPVNGQTMTVTQLSFFFNRSNSGPTQIRVRSSVNNFGSDIYSQAVTDGFQQAVINLSGSAYTNQSGGIRFRITACQNAATGGALRLDELVINGTVTVTPLPVSLLYFRAQPQPDNRVTLAWATTWERDADRFEIQRGRNLSEFGTIGQVSARGTTDSRQLYTFSDDWPDGGTTYYRLRQVDHDGSFNYSDIVAAVLDDETPTLQLQETGLPNLVRLKGRNLGGATFSVISPTGQLVPVNVRPESDGAIGLEGNFGAGIYLIRVDVRSSRLTQRALVCP